MSARTARKHRPVMLHRAILGSLERFIGMLIEHYAGRLPLWLAPVQAVVATITNEADGYAREVASALRAAGLRVELDTADRQDQLQGARAQPAQGAAAAGGRRPRGRASATVSLRRLGGTRRRPWRLTTRSRYVSERRRRPICDR